MYTILRHSSNEHYVRIPMKTGNPLNKGFHRCEHITGPCIHHLIISKCCQFEDTLKVSPSIYNVTGACRLATDTLEEH